MQPNLKEGLIAQIDKFVSEFNYGVQLLLAGVDSTGAHLYEVHNPGGRFDEYGQIGFNAIGIGQMHALHSMIGFRHSPTRDIYETIFSVYASKRRAEIAPGVGTDTDLVVITQGGYYPIASDKLNGLNALYQEHQKPATTELSNRVSKLDLFKEVK
jgi:hypothetical protein